jgi:5-methyltetrahydrofolate--homocysteine methyltransferase
MEEHMPSKSILSVIQSGAVLVSDGATGTNLQQRGLPAGVPPDEWVFDNPEAVLQLHRDFIAAGSNIILTDTFGATNLRLRGSKYEGKALELNERAASLARQAAAGTEVYVAGSLGPVGALIKPFGPLSPEEVRLAYAEQARALTDGGVDLLVIETQFSLEEALAALDGVQQNSYLPVVVSFSYDQGTRTMMGVKASQVMDTFSRRGVMAIGANCGKSLQTMQQVVEEMAAAETGVPIWSKPNAGMPIPGTMPARYDTTPEQMGEAAARLVAGGAQIVGGCCGTTPQHLAAIAAVVLQQ